MLYLLSVDPYTSLGLVYLARYITLNINIIHFVFQQIDVSFCSFSVLFTCLFLNEEGVSYPYIYTLCYEWLHLFALFTEYVNVNNTKHM